MIAGRAASRRFVLLLPPLLGLLEMLVIPGVSGQTKDRRSGAPAQRDEKDQSLRWWWDEFSPAVTTLDVRSRYMYTVTERITTSCVVMTLYVAALGGDFLRLHGRKRNRLRGHRVF